MKRQNIEVGSTVRLTANVGGITVSRRSLVATPPDENGCVSLEQDDLAPEPLKRRKFLIAPLFNSVGAVVKECEATTSEVTPLLDFEAEADNIDVPKATLVQSYKDYGDQLLRINDFTCAVAYYESALHFVSSKFDIGGTLVVKHKGHSMIAEVDCIENEGKNTRYDITYTSGEEATISQKEILLAIWAQDLSFIQPRILLNLSRCLLKLAIADAGTSGNANCVGEKSRQERYRLAAVKGCTIAITLCEYHALNSSDDSTAELHSLIEKARIVRSRAFLDLRKFPNATVDTKKVLANNAANREANKLLNEIKAAELHKKSVDKKLSKEVCKWVQTATNSAKGAEAIERMDDSVSDQETEEIGDDAEAMETTQMENVWPMIMRGISIEVFGLIMFIVAMWVVYPSSSGQEF